LQKGGSWLQIGAQIFSRLILLPCCSRLLPCLDCFVTD